MKDIVGYSQMAVSEVSQINKHTEADWALLAGVASTTTKWAADFAKIYEGTIQGCPHTKVVMEGINVSDHQASFAVWYEKLASGAPGEAFWSETCLTGLYHAAAGVHNRHVVAMGGLIQEEFLKRAIADLGAEKAIPVYFAFKRIFDTAVSVMVDSYLQAVMSGMAEIGIHERLVTRIRKVAIRRMIDRARDQLPLIDWSDALSVGIKQVDDQHKVLVDLLNALHDSSVSGAGNDQMKKILQDLLDYTITHFRDEEKLLERAKYPSIVGHKKAHVALTDQVGKFNDDFQAGNAKLSGDLFKFLRTWLNGHIRGTDRLYTKHLLENGIESGYE